MSNHVVALISYKRDFKNSARIYMFLTLLYSLLGFLDLPATTFFSQWDIPCFFRYSSFLSEDNPTYQLVLLPVDVPDSIFICFVG
jgi:hypothetical protein